MFFLSLHCFWYDAVFVRRLVRHCVCLLFWAAFVRVFILVWRLLVKIDIITWTHYKVDEDLSVNVADMESWIFMLLLFCHICRHYKNFSQRRVIWLDDVLLLTYIIFARQITDYLKTVISYLSTATFFGRIRPIIYGWLGFCSTSHGNIVDHISSLKGCGAFRKMFASLLASFGCLITFIFLLVKKLYL